MYGGDAVHYSTVTKWVNKITNAQKESEPVTNWSKVQSVEFCNEEICALAKTGKRQFGKQKITLRSNYKMLMLYTFF